MISIDFTYTIQLTEAQYAALLDRAAELEIPLEDLLLQAMQNYLGHHRTITQAVDAEYLIQETV